MARLAHPIGLGTLFLALGMGASSMAFAQETDAALLLKELRELKAQQAELNARINAVETAVAKIAGQGETALLAQEDEVDAALPNPNPVAIIPELEAEPLPTAAERLATAPQQRRRLDVGGDLLLRFEGNYNDPDAVDRERGVYRARLRTNFQATDRLTIGMLAETGDPDDPNSGFGTFSGFADDFSISLSQAFIQYDIGDVTLYGGKFPRPFVSTDTLWDGDAYPEGLAAQYAKAVGEGTFSASGLLFIVDENAGGADSQMLGGLIAYMSDPSTTLGVRGSLAYYDYELGSLGGGDQGDFRSNLIVPRSDGLPGVAYVSDYDIIDVIAGVDYRGMGQNWPLAVTANYIKNEGAASDINTAVAGYAFLGNRADKGDIRFGYGYAEVENDAVLAAFSNDNLSLGTNYRAHRATLDYMLTEQILLNATWYRYGVLDDTIRLENDDWRDRLRFNLMWTR